MKKLLFLAVVLVAGVAAADGGSWEKSSYVAVDWVEPAKRLMPSPKVSDNLFDRKVLTNYSTGSGGTMTCTWDTPKDVETIQVYAMDNAYAGAKCWGWSVEIASVSVLYDGDAEYTELPDSYVLYSESVPGGVNGVAKSLIYTGANGFAAKRVRGVKVVNGAWANPWAFGCGELVITGEDSVDEALSAEYQAAAGRYSARGSAVAADFPVDVYFCKGATDGGEAIDAWDSSVKIATLNSSEDVYETSGAIDFAYCRTCFTSPRYGDVVWAPGLTVDNNPYVVASVAERHTDSITMAATVQSPGASSSLCDIYFAYAPSGETMPEVALLKCGVPVGETVSTTMAGLSSASDYDYKFVIRNPQSGSATLAGTVSTLSAGAWALSEFAAASDYVFPENWLPNSTSIGRVPVESAGNTPANTEKTLAFAKPKNITRIDIYTLNGGRKNLGLANLKIKYEGSDEYVELPATSLSYDECAKITTTGIHYAFMPSDEFIAKNVRGIKIPVTKVHNNSTYVANIDVIGVPADYNGEYTWDFNYVDGVNFQRPADDLTPGATTTGISDNEKDGDITTYTQRGKNYNAYVWTFEKAKDITAIGLFSNTADSNNRSFSVGSVSVKHKGEADYTELPGIAFDYFNRGSNILSCVLRPTNKYIARDVTSLKVALGDKQSNWVNSFMAEVYCTGRDSVHGLMLLIR